MRNRIYVLILAVFMVGLIGIIASLSADTAISPLPEQGSGDPESSAVSESADLSERQSLDPVRVAEGFYGAPEGSRFSWQFHHATSYRMEALESEGDQLVATSNETVTIPFEGHLHMQILERDLKQVTVLVQGTEISSPVSAPADSQGEDELESCCEAVEEWFLVRIDLRGSILGYGFQDGLTPRQRNFARSIIGGFFHTVPRVLDSTWQADEADATGQYTADYQLLSTSEAFAEIERRKSHYTQIGASSQGMEHSLSGKSRARFDLAVHWIATVQVGESMTMNVQEFPVRVHLATKARFESITHDWPGIDLGKADWPAFVSPSGAGEDMATGNAETEEQLWHDKVDELSLDELLNDLRALMADNKTEGAEFYEAWQKLHWKLALDPEAVAAAEQLLLTGRMDEETGSLLLSALGKAGSPEAQNTLLKVYSAQNLADGWRESATFSMFQLATPTREVLNAVARRVQNLRAVDQLGAASVLLLGTLAPRQASVDGDEQTILAKLLALESRARDLGSIGIWLDALGNAAVPEIAPIAVRYLSHSEALIRESAVGALDSSMAKDIVSYLITAAAKDPAVAVRIRAIEALGKREAQAGRKTLRELVLNSKELAIRQAAVEALAARERLSAADRRALERVSRQDANQDLRDIASRLLGA